MLLLIKFKLKNIKLVLLYIYIIFTFDKNIMNNINIFTECAMYSYHFNILINILIKYIQYINNEQ